MSDTPKKTFHLEADIKFEALDLDDAFEQLTWHFGDLYDGVDSEFEFIGEIDLHKVAE